VTPSRGGDFQKRKVDGLCKQLYLLQKFRKIQEKLFKITKKEILMDDISRSCDLLGGGTSKKRNFDGLCKQFFNSENTKKLEK
jgi:hypothetical protein